MTPDEAETEALAHLNRMLREGRRFPRRHMILALAIVLPAILLLLALAILLSGLLNKGHLENGNHVSRSR